MQGAACRACLFGGALFAAGIAAGPAAGQLAHDPASLGKITADRVSGNDPYFVSPTASPFGFGTFAYSVTGLSASFTGTTTEVAFTHNRSTSAQFSYSLAGAIGLLAALQPTPVEITWSLGTWANAYVVLANYTTGEEIFHSGAQAAGSASFVLPEGFQYFVAMATFGTTAGGNSSASLKVVERCPADIDGNGVVNLDDIGAFVDSFLLGCS